MDQRSIPYISMTDFVDQYMASAGLDRQKYVENYLIHASWVYKELLWSTVWQIKSVWKEVKSENGQYYFDVPADSVRVINASRVDSKGREIPFLIDDRINTLAPVAKNGVICESCGGTNDLGACLSNITVTTKQVYINGNPYVEKTWKKMDADGTLMEVREVWVLDYSVPDPPTVSKKILYRKLCQFEVKQCGCVNDCTENRQLVELYCGSSCATTKAALTGCNDWAKIKIKNGRIYFSVRGKLPDFVKLDYQTNGECGLEELMIPEYVVPALTFGTHWRAGALAPENVVSRGEKRERERMFENQKQKLLEFESPIRIADFLDVQMSIPKWGGTNLECEPINVRDAENILFDLSKLDLDMGNKCCCLSSDDIKKIIDDRLAAFNPQNGLQGPAGPQGPTGPTGPIQVANLSYHHDQSVAATVWTINHNLGFNPNIEIKDKSGVTLWGWNFNHTSVNQVVITHSVAVAGDAYLT